MASHGHQSSSPSTCEYEVFLNFRGEDTRGNFISHLYSALDNKGVRTFIDNNENQIGKEIKPELVTAIVQSRISIPVFSKDYASSKWCLQELTKILQCRKSNKQIVLPIFLDVEPSEIGNQTGSFGEAFRKLEEEPEIVEKWRKVLRKAGKLKGWDLKKVENGNESKLIKLVVGEVLSTLNNTQLDDAKHPIGLDFRLKEMLSLLSLPFMDSRFVGIYGMGGIGKTIMAKAVYNEISNRFDGNSFLADVDEQASRPSGLVDLQKQLINDILGKQNLNISHVHQGSKLIEQRFKRKKILLVLDDVDDPAQLNALARELNWFGPGSRIIITTRNQQVLKVGRVNDNDIYNIKVLDDNHSLQLFSMHAFGINQPPEHYMELSRKLINYAAGLPLTLEVMGSSLCCTRKEEWESALNKWKVLPPAEVHQKLKISYDKLENTEKAIFLDIACFFIGMNKEKAMYIWEGCGFHPDFELNLLIRRSLVSINEKNELRMHNQLRDMGRRIVHEQSPNEPGERSRLWNDEEIMKVLAENKKNRKVEGIYSSGWKLKDRFRIEDFAAMSNLRLLQVNGVDLERNIEHLYSELRWLCWQRCLLESLPFYFYLEELVVLDLPYSGIKQAWNSMLQNRRFEKLKVLNLSDCWYLARSPDFSGFPGLEILTLRECRAMVELHESIGKLSRLVRMDLTGCIKLIELPCSICMLDSLQELILSKCYRFKELPKSIGDLISLKRLELNETQINMLPKSIGKLWNLRYLSLRDCHSLIEIPHIIGRLKSLVVLDLGHTFIPEIPVDVDQLKKLEELYVEHCPYLEALPELPSSLKCLYASDCKSLEKLPNLSNLKHLQTLQIMNCEKLAEIPGMDSFEDLDLSGCITLTMVRDW